MSARLDVMRVTARSLSLTTQSVSQSVSESASIYRSTMMRRRRDGSAAAPAAAAATCRRASHSQLSASDAALTQATRQPSHRTGARQVLARASCAPTNTSTRSANNLKQFLFQTTFY